MVVNGFDSNQYRYFKIVNDINWKGSSWAFSHLKKGDIVKIPNGCFKNGVLSSNFWNRLKNYIEPFEMKTMPSNEPFDFFKYLSLQGTMTFKYDSKITLIFDYGQICYLSDWLKSKLNDESVPVFSLTTGARNIKELNQYEFSMLYKEEKGKIVDTRKLLGTGKNDALVMGEDEDFNVFVSNGQTVRLTVPVKKGEVWSFNDFSIILALIDQDFIRLFANSTEILGKEKERIFEQEYKDNIPNEEIRYYKVKDGIKVHSRWDIWNDTPNIMIGNGYDPFLARILGTIDVCEHNPNNYNEDGTLKYFSVVFNGSLTDGKMEDEVLKIADRVSQEEAITRYREDLEAYKRHAKEKEAERYLKQNKSAYRKYGNKDMTPMEFMEFDQNRKKKALVYRLVKSLNKRIENYK